MIIKGLRYFRIIIDDVISFYKNNFVSGAPFITKEWFNSFPEFLIICDITEIKIGIKLFGVFVVIFVLHCVVKLLPQCWVSTGSKILVLERKYLILFFIVLLL